MSNNIKNLLLKTLAVVSVAANKISAVKQQAGDQKKKSHIKKACYLEVCQGFCYNWNETQDSSF